MSACIVLALLALVAVPVLGDRYTRRFHAEMREVAEPGRGLVTDIQLALAQEGSALHDYVTTRDSLALARYGLALARERAAYDRLAPLAQRLGPGARRWFEELRTVEGRWHATVDRFLRGAPAAGDRSDPVQEGVYDDALIAAALLDEAITAAAEHRRRQILDAERLERRLTVLLGIMAAAAAVLTAWLGRRLHVYADALGRRGRELEQVLESKARLVRGLSHDLKNPLGVIDGHGQLLLDGIRGPLAVPQRESVERILRAVRSLLALLDDLLELSQVEAAHLRIDVEPVDAAALVRDAAEEHRAAAEAAGHALDVQLGANLPMITTDARRVRQVLGNLLSNAVKYTPPGGRLEVRAELRQSQGGPGPGRWLAIAVADSGPGVPPDRVAYIFDEFARLNPHAAPGAGLGLAIARRIARLLGGDITVDSEPRRGATFTLWLPLNRRNERAGTTSPA